MKKLILGLIASAIIFAPAANAGTGPSPTEDQRCMNPAYVHMHPDRCANAMFPPDYGDHEWHP